MRILMLSWEYPPKNIGGLSNHVYNMSHALMKFGHEVHVITCEEGTAPVEELDNGVHVHRITPYKVDTDDFVKWVMQMNFAMVEEGTRLIRKTGKFNIIHAHDWLTAFSAKALKWSFSIPMVSTIHATEYGRNNGIRTEMQRYISGTEWLLTYESWKVVACSNYMRQQVSDIFKTPWDKIWVISNGINVEDYKFGFDWVEYRRRFARDNEKIVFFVGRHVFEKGIHLLVDCIPEIVRKHPEVKVVIAGTGSMTDELKQNVLDMGLQDSVLFTGYMDDDSKKMMYRIANAAVFPSLYEPFGIVALEAMAAGCPVIVSDTGGLSEIVQHKHNGMKAIAGSAESLSQNIQELLSSDELSQSIKEKAKTTVEKYYGWDYAAELTDRMYKEIEAEAHGTDWEVASDDREEHQEKAGQSTAAEEELATLALSSVAEDRNEMEKKVKRSRKPRENKTAVQRETAADLEAPEKKAAPKTRRRKKAVSAEQDNVDK